ncbi:MAG: ABC transporter substrate-binding protein [Propionicimonas sp.]
MHLCAAHRKGPIPMHSRRFPVVVAASALVLSLAACGSGQPSLDSGSASPASSRTVMTSLGAVEVPASPERVVVMNVQQASMVVSLGVTPVGVAGEIDPYYTWLADDIGPLINDQLQDASYVLSPEAVAALDPDVIFLGNWQVADTEVLERLQGIAPVVTTASKEVVPAWQDSVTTIGEALGVPEKAATLIDEIETEYRELGERTGVVGKSYQYFGMSKDSLTSGNALTLQLAGMVPGKHQDVEGVVSNNDISLEQVPDLDADLLLIWNFSPRDLADLPGFDSLPSVVSGNFHQIDAAQAAALTGPEPIGLRGFLLDTVTPMLETLGR